MARAKTIEMLLMDGNVDGRIKCSLPGTWVGRVYKIPRESIELGRSREDLNQSGIYFLFGETVDGKPEIYVGQAVERKNGNGITQRLLEHKKPSEDYWTEAVVLTTSDNSFGPSEISYLEHKFYRMALEAGRYVVHNANDPNPGHVSEEKEAELENHVDNVVMIIGTLGYKVFVKEEHRKKGRFKKEKSITEGGYKVQCVGKSTKTDAGGVCTADGKITVLKGSKVSDTISPIFHKNGGGYYKTRTEFEKDGTIKNKIFQRDWDFGSVSEAAAIVLGRKANGRTEWKLEDGRPVREILKK